MRINKKTRILVAAVLMFITIVSVAALKLQKPDDRVSARTYGDAERLKMWTKIQTDGAVITIGDYEYSYYINDDNASVSIYEVRRTVSGSYVEDYAFPAKINGYPVTVLTNYWEPKGEPDANGNYNTWARQKLCKNFYVTGKLTVPEGVCELGLETFYNNQFVEVSLPSTLTYMCSSFYNCKYLKKVVIPDKVTELGVSCFEGCAALESLKLNEGLVKIRSFAFKGCDKLTKLDLPSTLEFLEREALKGLPGLTKIVFPRKINSIAAYNGRSTITDSDFAFYCYKGSYVQEQFDKYGIEYTLVDGDVLKGDLNLDKEVNNQDLLIMRRTIAGSYALNDLQFSAADITGDVEVNNQDLLLLRRYLADNIHNPLE